MKSQEIIRSSKYTGDIGEYIAKEVFELSLSSNQREISKDAIDKDGNSYEIKFHNAEKGTNLIIDNYNAKNINFDYMYVLLGSESSIRDDKTNKYDKYFIVIYKFTKDEILELRKDRKNIAKRVIRSKKPIKGITYDLEIENI